MGLICDAAHLFFDTLTLLLGLLSFYLSFRQKLIRTRFGLFNVDDVLW